MKKWCAVCSVFILIFFNSLFGTDTAPTGGHKIRIILVSDSTVNDRTGWGLGFKQFVDTNQVEVINVAAGGRSSLSFMREGRWTNALALKGDYYLIQFGHNNQPGKPGRSTDMATFVANMEQYVDDARAIGAKPILVTPLTRRQWDKQNPGKIKSTLEPYAGDVRKIAAEKNVPLVDLHARSIELCEQLGPQKCLEFSPIKIVDGTNVYDGTHLMGPGRVMFARLVVDELRKAAPELAPVLLAEPRDPMPTLPEDGYDAVVAADISASYTNLQAAINATPDNGTRPYRILIKPGAYQGQFMVPKGKNHIELMGEDWDNTVLTYGLNVREADTNTYLRFKGTGVIVLGDDFTLTISRSKTLPAIMGRHWRCGLTATGPFSTTAACSAGRIRLCSTWDGNISRIVTLPGEWTLFTVPRPRFLTIAKSIARTAATSPRPIHPRTSLMVSCL